MKRGEFSRDVPICVRDEAGHQQCPDFSSGELSTFVLDGLFALDEQGTLFPGVT